VLSAVGRRDPAPDLDPGASTSAEVLTAVIYNLISDHRRRELAIGDWGVSGRESVNKGVVAREGKIYMVVGSKVMVVVSFCS
jgi:hypothetical protein